MKTFEELIEEVYQAGDLRQEFVKYARLKALHRAMVNQMKATSPALEIEHLRVMSYEEIVHTKPSPSQEAIELKRGMLFLSSALFKTLSQRYSLEAEEVKKLREAVAAKYQKGL